MTENEKLAMLRGAAYMREKIAQCIEASPRKAIYECAPHIRNAITLPSPEEIEDKADKWLDALLDSE